MSNMSYCRFENTSGDLQDCINAVGEMIEGGYDLDEYEQRAFQRLIKQAAELLELVGDSVGMEVEELCHKIEWEGESVVEDFRDSCGDAEDAEGDEE
jgi:hypothetical protein